MSIWFIRRLTRKGTVTLAAAGILVGSGAAVAYAAPGTGNPSAPGQASKQPTGSPVIGSLHLAGFPDPQQAPLDEPVYSVDSSSQNAGIGSQTGGAGAGKITFSPLVISIPADSSIPVLLGAEVSGAQLSAVVTVYQPGTTTPQFTETFTPAIVKSQEIKGNADGVGQTLTFQYGAVSYSFPS